MPILYDIDREHRIMYERWLAPISIDEVTFISTDPQKDELFPTNMRGLLVMDHLPPLTVSDLGKVIIQSMKYRDGFKNCKWGFVASEQKIIKVLNRFRQLAYILPIEMRIFFTEAEAKDWLGIPEYSPPTNLLSTQNEKAAP